MADQWMMTTRLVKLPGGQDKVPVAVIDLKITRRVMVTLNELDGLDTSLVTLGMEEIRRALDIARNLKADEVPYVNVPWRTVESVQFDTDSIISLLQASSKKIFWRLEGSPKTGLQGIVSCGGSEAVYDMSRDNLEKVVMEASEKIDALEAMLQTETDEAKRSAITVTENALKCIAGSAAAAKGGHWLLRTFGVAMAAYDCYKAFDEAERALDEAKRKQKEQEVRDGLNDCDGAEGGGSGPFRGPLRPGPDVRMPG